MPQLELQQTNPCAHKILPHCCSFGMQSCLVQPFPGSTQVPQLGLQHSRPGLHTVKPHCSPDGGSTKIGGQMCWVHIMSGLVHRPQDALQQVIPSGQIDLPHFSPLIGTHRALPSITLQEVPMAHLTVAQGVSDSLGLTSIGLALAPRVAKTANSRALVEQEKRVMTAVSSVELCVFPDNYKER